MMNTVELSNLEIRNLLLKTLAYKGTDIDKVGNYFEKYDYQGTKSDLFRLLNGFLIKEKIRVDNDTKVTSAWTSGWEELRENSNTTLNKREILKMYQEFNNLILQGVIAPGVYGNLGGSDLPYFHVTEYGHECLKKIDILPYDQEGYLKKLENISGINEWVLFYVTEALGCFNANCINSSMINIGLAGEVLIEELTHNFKGFLNKKDITLYKEYKKRLEKIRMISDKYDLYIEFHEIYLSNHKDLDLKKLNPRLDNSSRQNYATFTRLTRNSLSHPNEIKMDRIKTLMFFITFVDYCELQYLFINYYKSKSEN